MGSGPCVYLASTRRPGAIILMSSFRNIKTVVYDNFYFLSTLVSEQFDNLKLVSKILSPCLFIHGEKDNFVNFQHSVDL